LVRLLRPRSLGRISFWDFVARQSKQHLQQAELVPHRRQDAKEFLNAVAQWQMLPPNLSELQNCASTLYTWCCNESLRRVLTDVANELRDKGALDEEECFIDTTFAMAKGGGSKIGPTKRGKGMTIWRLRIAMGCRPRSVRMQPTTTKCVWFSSVSTST
jgi:hypothetical protein